MVAVIVSYCNSMIKLLGLPVIEVLRSFSVNYGEACEMNGLDPNVLQFLFFIFLKRKVRKMKPCDMMRLLENGELRLMGI